MIDFFNTHIDPASKTRAKIATHMLAKGISAQETTTTSSSSSTTTEQKKINTETQATNKDDTASTTSSELRVEEQKKEVGVAVRIEDIRSFKAAMPLSEAMRAVRNISEFEDLGSKL
jgi:insulysin